MPGTNDFFTFAGGVSANVLTQSAYAALTALRANGFQSGVAESAQLNKVWRQSSIMANMLAQFIIANNGTADVLDTGTSTQILADFTTALQNAVAAYAGLPRFLDKDTSYLAEAVDAGAVINFTVSGTTLTLPAAASLGNGWFCTVRNAAANGYVTIDPNSTEQIDGGLTTAVPAGVSIVIRCNGTSFVSFSWPHRVLVGSTSITPASDEWAFSLPDGFMRYVNSLDLDFIDLYLSGTDTYGLQVGAGTDGAPTWVTSNYHGLTVRHLASGGAGDDNYLYPHSVCAILGNNSSATYKGIGSLTIRKQDNNKLLFAGCSAELGVNGYQLSGEVTASGFNRIKIYTVGSTTLSSGDIRVWANIG